MNKPAGGMPFGAGGAGQFGAGIMGGAATGAIGGAAKDPYGNIDIDFTKVSLAPKPAKPFEAKTEEEKVADAEARGGMKSNLKTTQADK